VTPGRCRDEGDRPGCLGIADPRYEMRFDDIGEAPLHWCAACGPEAHAMSAALDVAFAVGGEAFKAELAAAIDAVEAARN
jgi:hypothetical protein